MAKNIVPSDITSLLDQWIEAEKKGNQFPVPFDAAWRIAEYSNKANAKRELKSLKKGKQFSSDLMKTPGGGRPSELINLSVNGFEHFCLMADTPMGEAVRDYFIDARNKWELTKQIAPEFAGQIEVIAEQKELEKLRQQTFKAEQNLLSFRHWINTALEPADRDRVLGITEFKTVEYRKTIVDDSGFVLNAGDTLNKGQLCQEFGFVTRTGNPDYKAINKLLAEA